MMQKIAKSVVLAGLQGIESFTYSWEMGGFCCDRWPGCSKEIRVLTIPDDSKLELLDPKPLTYNPGGPIAPNLKSSALLP